MSNIFSFLPRVEKPGRYVGEEFNSIKKDLAGVKVSFALAFPDIYEVGMSYLGFKILYDILNKNEGVYVERIYAPWIDMEKIMRDENEELFSMESNRPFSSFDLVGFTLQYEMSYTNILNMLSLGNVTLFAKDRRLDEPFIVGGGPCVYNPEPLADFFDFFIIGEGEEVILEVTQAMESWKEQSKSGGREGFLKEVSKISGIYVPSFYDAQYDENGFFQGLKKLKDWAPDYINKRFIKDLDSIESPTAPVVPFCDIVHDRVMVEVFRGCTRGCRFCHAGMVYRPVRERTKENIKGIARSSIDNTGYDEISLTSLSTADYSQLPSLIDEMSEEFQGERVSISLPSLRIDSFDIELAKKVQRVRKSGLTFAPEAGTQRMRDVINKGVTEEDLLLAAKSAFESGWSSIKLYFMIGLPTETKEDIEGIAKLAYKVLDVYTKTTGKRNGRVTVSVSTFVPKPWTPFQWSRENTAEEIKEKQMFLKDLLKNKAITYQYHDSKTSIMEGVFARGDRRLSSVLYNAFLSGAKFDGWTEFFSYERWLDAMAKSSLDINFYIHRERAENEVFPWGHIRPGVSNKFLYSEYEKAKKAEITHDCRRSTCYGCGVCTELSAQIVDHAREI